MCIWRTTGLHPNLEPLKDMYEAGDLALIANAGALTEPLTIDDWKRRSLGLKKVPPGLFAHNVMQKTAKTVHADDGNAKGLLGRMVQELASGPTPMRSALYVNLAHAVVHTARSATLCRVCRASSLRDHFTKAHSLPPGRLLRLPLPVARSNMSSVYNNCGRIAGIRRTVTLGCSTVR